MSNPRLSEAFDEYLASMRVRGRSRATIRSREQMARNFILVTGNIYLHNVTDRHVEAFFKANPQWSPATAKKVVSYFSDFQRWAQNRRYVGQGDLLDSMRGIRVPKQDRLRLDAAVFPDLLDATNNPRDRIVVALGCYLFLRGSEVTALRWRHVHLDRDEIEVWREKTDTWDHEMPICVELHAELERWRQHVASTVGIPQPDWFLAPSYNAGPDARDPVTGLFIGAKQLDPTRPVTRPYHSVKEALARLGYPTDRQGVHTLRRSGARALYDELVNRGHDGAVRTVQSILGHSSIAVTEAYLGVDIDRKRRNDVVQGKRMFGGAAWQNAGSSSVTSMRRSGG